MQVNMNHGTRDIPLAEVEDSERVVAAWNAALHGDRYDIEYRILVGEELEWARERAEFTRDGDGNPLSGLGTVQDITDPCWSNDPGL